jgi:hypothetical protein
MAIQSSSSSCPFIPSPLVWQFSLIPSDITDVCCSLELRWAAHLPLFYRLNTSVFLPDWTSFYQQQNGHEFSQQNSSKSPDPSTCSKWSMTPHHFYQQPLSNSERTQHLGKSYVLAAQLVSWQEPLLYYKRLLHLRLLHRDSLQTKPFHCFPSLCFPLSFSSPFLCFDFVISQYLKGL